MLNENYNMPVQYEKGQKEKSALGIVFLIPIILIIVIFMISPFLQTLIRSFTNYNFNHRSELVMLKNYQMLFSDTVVKKSILDTLIMTFIAVPLTAGIGFLFAWLSSKIHKGFRYILCILYLVVSVTAITPTGLNALLYSLHLLDNSASRLPINVMISFLLGVGPIYLIFTIYFMIRDNIKKYIHIALSLQIVICFLSFFAIKFLIANMDTYNKSIAGNIYKLALITFQGGYASAVAIVMTIMLVLLFVLFNGTVWLMGMITRKDSEKYVADTQFAVSRQADYPMAGNQQLSHTFLSILTFTLLTVISVVLMYPFLQALSDSFKPAYELNNSVKLFTSNPTLEHYSNALGHLGQGTSFTNYLLNSILTLIIATAVIFPISLIGSIGFKMLGGKGRGLTLLVLITFFLSPVILMFFTRSNFNDNSLVLIAIPIVIKSAAFGLSIFLSTKLLERCTANLRRTSEILNSAGDLLKYLFGVLLISLVTSLAAYFNPVYLPAQYFKMNLYQLYQRNASAMMATGEVSSLLVITMIIPIGIIAVSIPIVLSFISNKSKNKQFQN